MIVESASAHHSSSVDVRAVGREAVVDHRPLATYVLEQRMRPRHLGVPVKRDVGLRLSADGDPLDTFMEDANLLLPVAGPPGEKRVAAGLGFSQCQRLDRGDRTRLRSRNVGHGTIEPLPRRLVETGVD